ncbi:hypothetical protein KRMM14A1004_24240 [Krasilnikovia sp. MM14-A1004]
MRTVPIRDWGTITLFTRSETETGIGPALPPWLPTDGSYSAAQLTARALPGRPMDYIAVWREDAPIPDLACASPWTEAQLDGLVLAEARDDFRCRVCHGLVNALYPAAIPLLDRFSEHRSATHCPICGAHVDRARLHALRLFAPEAPG